LKRQARKNQINNKRKKKNEKIYNFNEFSFEREFRFVGSGVFEWHKYDNDEYSEREQTGGAYVSRKYGSRNKFCRNKTSRRNTGKRESGVSRRAEFYQAA
jgi:hypothetical protein